MSSRYGDGLWLGFVILTVMSTACQSDDTALGVAEHFLDAHYVRIDLAAASRYCTGLARRRVDEETRLTAGHTIDVDTNAPRVYYRLLTETPRGESGLALRYELTFDVDGAGQFQKIVLLTLRLDSTGWSVSNYTEFD